MPNASELPSGLSSRAFSVAEGRRAGLTRDRMRSADLGRPFHGVRLPSVVEATLIERCHAYAARLRPGEFFSHTTAAVLWGCPLPRLFERADAALHVSIPAPGRAAEGRGVVGHSVDPDAGRVTVRSGIPVSDAASTWCDLASILVRSRRTSGELLGLDDLVAAGDHLVLTPRSRASATERPYLDLVDLTERVHRGFRRRGVAGARIALRAVRDGAESRPESLVRLALVRAGLPEPVLNEPVHDHRGLFLGRADMQYREYAVIVEYDGEQHRLEDTQYERDERRLENFQLAGYLVIRIRKSGLRTLPTEANRVQQALHLRGWPR